MSPTIARRVAITLALATLPAGLVACEAILGLGGETPLVEAGASEAAARDVSAEARRDARADAPREADAGVDRREADAPEPPGAAVAVAFNVFGTNWCAITHAGDVECWGTNETGELGDGTTTTRTTPVKVVGLPGPAASVAIGVGTTCAVLRSGALYCWGYGRDGERGDGTKTDSVTHAVAVSGLDTGVTAVSCGYYVGCAVKSGAVYCWGLGQFGLLGTTQTTDALVPVAIPSLASGVTSVAVGGGGACAVQSGGVYCWGGFDGYGELGNGTTKGSRVPVPVTGLASGVAAVSAGLDFECALTDAGGVQCWGDGTSGQLGNGQLATSPVPVQVQGLASGVTAISAGALSVTALRTGGDVVAWGYASDGELGNGSALPDSSIGGGAGSASDVPVKVKGLSSPAIAVSTGLGACVATVAGGVECWGVVAENALTPVPVTALGASTSLTTGGVLSTGLFTCAIPTAGSPIKCWGGNGAGQLGNGTTVGSAIPVANTTVVVGATAVSGSSGGDFACGIASGLVYCWGDNRSGQLGNGTTVSSPSPVAVVGLPGPATAVAAGADSACAITAGGPDAGPGGALYCWGDNTYGQLGNGTTAPSLSPVLVSALGGNVATVSMGIESACAALVDGTLYCWGDNQSGQIGDGTKTTRLSPVSIAGVTGVTNVSVGWFSACAVTGTGKIKCWGANPYGQLGDGSYTWSTVPVAVASLGGKATRVAVGPTSACAVVNGGAKCWGNAAIGNDALPSLVFLYPAPVVGLSSGVTEVAVAVEFACAAVAGGVRCWGVNSDGQLGNGGAIDAFLPVPVPGFP